jgi:uncharacterized membrane protein
MLTLVSLMAPTAFGGEPAAAVSEAAAAAGCRIAHYQPIELPLNPAAINASGQVAGTTPAHRAALWSAATGLHELPLPRGYEHSEPVALNARGHVAGMAYDQSFNRHRPFLFADGVLTLLSPDNAQVFAINDAGDVAGEAVMPGKVRSEPVVWHRGRTRVLASCCGGTVKRLTAGGDAIGDAYDPEGRYYAVLWSGARSARRIGPADRFSSAVAANERGHVVIEVPSRVFFFADDTLTRLDLAPKRASHPHAMNECDLVVGSFGPFSDAAGAFAWEASTGFTDLNKRIAPDSGWHLESATGINNRGDIVGKGDRPGKDEAGFLLIPVDAPAE